MDGKPQRPLKSVRAGVDENSFKPELQKQKSMSALTSMSAIGGGLRVAAKRTAFNDLNTKNLPVGQEDSGKAYDVKKVEDAAPALARPPTRAVAKVIQQPLPSAKDMASVKVQPVAPKRTNAVFKDSDYQLAVAHGKELINSLNLRDFQALTSQNLIEHGHSGAMPVTDGKQSSVGESSAGEHVEGSLSATSEESREAEQKAHIHDGYLTTMDALKNDTAMSRIADDQTEEMWEFEDEEGYTTAYSFRSRDNTTGAITTALYPKFNDDVREELENAAEVVLASTNKDEVEDEAWDISMVAEYSDEIFEYMRELELEYIPSWNYMRIQGEIQWSMRAVLMDWMVQVHTRFGLLPETLFLCVNCIDRFLEVKVVSLGKLQLVGITALYIAAKYEEVQCPALHEVSYMVDNGYSQDEILKAERYMLGMIQFSLGNPGPLSFLRRISKADDYDLMTRTLAKYFIELTIMDERFVGLPPSFIAAGGHCAARLVLKKANWTQHHIHYSGYTWKQLKPLVCLMFSCCENAQQHHISIFDKYADRRYKRASLVVLTELAKGIEIPGHRGQFFAYSQYLTPAPPASNMLPSNMVSSNMVSREMVSNMVRGPYYPTM